MVEQNGGGSKLRKSVSKGKTARADADDRDEGALFTKFHLEEFATGSIAKFFPGDSGRRLAAHCQAKPGDLLLFAADPGFNPGGVGLAASRLTEQYYRPAIVAAQSEEITRGSCRSIPEFHITEALDACADLLHHYGGHAAAAGFTIYTHLLPEFLDRLEQIATRKIGSLDLRPVLEIDAAIELNDLRAELLNELKVLQPTGMSNRAALFLTRNALVKSQRAIGKDKTHLKLVLEDNQRVLHDAIAFRLGHLAGGLPNRVDVVYTFERNEYNGQSYMQLNVRDIRPANRG